ncbi:hypothetical protein Athai_47200 [Actinocatenispora thailandica]|uniref:N-acetyltransferase domain-containing protein n=1 Tax=Actinocatenispora thailandica TaxID=227318 RepID=A0A7R7DTE5_9ACTN|nr:GNAT family N-acetyltransferase [Actinocatenispora thailandica]BCJ37217.1 hypothetical protein Athai_47200 [Actinocatenispora thailandica]
MSNDVDDPRHPTDSQRHPAAQIFPDVVLITERVLLRPYTETDVDAHQAIFNHDLVRRWSIAAQPYTYGDAARWCTRTAAEIRLTGDGICWAAEDRASSRLIGVTGFHRTDWSERSTEVSATAAEWALRQGYAKEALLAMSHWVLTVVRFNRVQISAAVGNRPPRAVAEACGFTAEGVLRNAASVPAGRVDVAVYGLVPGDLRGRPRPRYRVAAGVEPQTWSSEPRRTGVALPASAGGPPAVDRNNDHSRRRS